MPDPVHGTPENTPGFVMSPVEKLACEWEARHDVAARGRQVDPAVALQHYLSHTRCAEELIHQDHPAHPSGSAAARRAPRVEEFAAEHPLVASWMRWGEDRRR